MKKLKRIVNYPTNDYPCQVLINKRWFTKIEISEYWKKKRGRSTVSDDKIVELVRQLHGKETLRDNEYFSDNHLYIDYRAYNLVWDYDEEQPTNTLLIINCHREKKYDKK